MQSRNLYRDLLREEPNCHGGKGSIRVHTPYRQAQGSSLSFIDLVVIPPASSIGLHRHGQDQETYIVLSGTGTMECNAERFAVSSGDVIVNPPRGSHGLVNDSESDLHLLVFEVATHSNEG